MIIRLTKITCNVCFTQLVVQIFKISCFLSCFWGVSGLFANIYLFTIISQNGSNGSKMNMLLLVFERFAELSK